MSVADYREELASAKLGKNDLNWFPNGWTVTGNFWALHTIQGFGFPVKTGNG